MNKKIKNIKKKTKNNCCTEERSADHSAEIPRINRISGQLEGIKKMIENKRYCPEILIQLRAIRSAIRAVEGNILKTHLQSCVTQSFLSEKERSQKIDEIKELFDRFEG
jgi:CsoR family transcriptional regulator, copper-sensing transcriptional repressor